MELDFKAIGKRVRIARVRADMSQEKLAGEIGVSPPHMSNIERGTSGLSLEAVINIANALSVTADDLLCDEVVHCRPQFERDIQLLLDSCDDYEIRIVRDMVAAILPALRRDAHLRGIEKEGP